jgi:hypothetical protein
VKGGVGGTEAAGGRCQGMQARSEGGDHGGRRQAPTDFVMHSLCQHTSRQCSELEH